MRPIRRSLLRAGRGGGEGLGGGRGGEKVLAKGAVGTMRALRGRAWRPGPTALQTERLSNPAAAAAATCAPPRHAPPLNSCSAPETRKQGLREASHNP